MRSHKKRPPVPKTYTPGVVFQPATYQGFQRGVNLLVNAIRPTLGPLPRLVALENTYDKEKLGSAPELVDDGGLIARRIFRLNDRDADMGAMFLRQALWHLREHTGDGTATAAVLFQSIFEQGVRHIVYGGNAIRLKHFLEEALIMLNDELSKQTINLQGKQALADLAYSVCYETKMAQYLGEIFDIIGEYGLVEIRAGRSRNLEREYVEGMYWDKGVFAPAMLTDQSKLRAVLENTAILISDLEFDQPEQLFPALAATLDAQIPSLLILAEKLSEKTIAFLLANKKPEKFQAIAVRTPGTGKEDQADAMQDLAILTGGNPFIKSAGQTLVKLKLSDLGRARRVWVDQKSFGIVAGKGNPHKLRRHLLNLRHAYAQTSEQLPRQKLQQRIGKLLGGSATLWIGGITEREINQRIQLAERASEALRGAIREGAVAGGGIALFKCRSACALRLSQCTDPDEQAAYRILYKALEVPLRTIITNAGFNADEVVAEIKMAGNGYGFDVHHRKVVQMSETGILDIGYVQKAALRSAVSSAALALTVDVLIHHRRPIEAREP